MQPPTTTHRLLIADSRSPGGIADDSVDLVVTSPPYPMIEMWDSLFCRSDARIAPLLQQGAGHAAFELMHRQLDEVWRNLWRVVKTGGIVCINIGDATRTVDKKFQLYTNHSRILHACCALGFETLPLVLWRKQTNAPNKFMGSGMLPGGAYVTLEHEYILIMRKGGKRNFDTPAARLTRRESAYFWEERNRWFSDLWDFKGTRQALGENNLRSRSAAFPLELPHRLINMYSVRNDTVLDPFCGTGTTQFAAMAAARHSIGIESDISFRQPFLAASRSIIPTLNDLTCQRFANHCRFVQEYTAGKGALRHMNRRFAVPVVTEQESDLDLLLVDRLDADTDDPATIIATHRQFDPASDAGPLQQGLPL